MGGSGAKLTAGIFPTKGMAATEATEMKLRK
jgi:hypothetical protein